LDGVSIVWNININFLFAVFIQRNDIIVRHNKTDAHLFPESEGGQPSTNMQLPKFCTNVNLKNVIFWTP